MADDQNLLTQDPQDSETADTTVQETVEGETMEVPEEQEVIAQNPNHVIVSDLSEEDKTAKGAKWYVLHTYAGHENRVAEQMKQRVQTMGLNDFIYEMLIPTQ